jgi:hypothetical protein
MLARHAAETKFGYLGFVIRVGTYENHVVTAGGHVQLWIPLAKYPQRPLLSLLHAGRSGLHPQTTGHRCPLALSWWLPFKGSSEYAYGDFKC